MLFTFDINVMGVNTGLYVVAELVGPIKPFDQWVVDCYHRIFCYDDDRNEINLYSLFQGCAALRDALDKMMDEEIKEMVEHYDYC